MAYQLVTQSVIDDNGVMRNMTIPYKVHAEVYATREDAINGLKTHYGKHFFEQGFREETNQLFIQNSWGHIVYIVTICKVMH